jgi:hypothetical protein
MWIVGMGEEPEIDTLKRISHGSQRFINVFIEWSKMNLFREAVLRLKGGGIFPVHRVILSACSAYFRTLLTTILYFKNIDVLVPGMTSQIVSLML